MFGKKINLFKLFGFQVSIDLTWLILAFLITFTLAEGVFPHFFEGYSTSTYWLMGLGGAAGLFVSIVWHEFSHSLVARRFGMPMRGITLFIFGGVAEMNEEPPSAKAEFFMAIAGPISSIVLGFILLGILWSIRNSGSLEPASGVLWFISRLNFILAGFNLVPAFPLDGGRVLRSILWGAKKDLRWATRIASGAGTAFGWFLMIFGIFRIFSTGNILGGGWLILIGLFIKGASQMSYRQLIIKKSLEGDPVSNFMKPEPITLEHSLSVQNFVDDYYYKYHFKMFPVVNGNHLIGCLTSKSIKDIPRDQWQNHTVEDLIHACSPDNTINPDADATAALSQMNNTDNRRLMVVEGDRLVGVITMKDMLDFLAIKLDLERS